MARTDRLEKLQQKLISRREELRNRLNGGHSYDNDSGLHGEGDAGDVADYNSSSELNIRLEAMEYDEIQEIDMALQKFDEGTYGICEVSGEAIPIARLEALPFTRFSVEAQREMEAERARG